MKCWLPLCLGLFGVVLTGCPEWNHYELELRPNGDGFERQLTSWREPDGKARKPNEPFPVEQLARCEEIYGEPPATPTPEHFRFAGRFAGKTPQDIGGAGSYTAYDTPMGSITLYSERFRGNDDLVGQFEERGKAARRLADLVVGWFETQMGGDPNWPKVRQFLEGDFVRDLHNLSLYLWVTQVNMPADYRQAKSPPKEIELRSFFTPWIARVGQYLAERGYIEPEEIVPCIKAMERGENSSLWPECIQNRVAKKVGLLDEEAAAKSLGFLSEPDQAIASWYQFLEKTPEYEALIRTWEDKRARAPGQPRPTPDAVVAGIIFQGLWRWNLVSDVIKIELATGQRPLVTNGQWDEQVERVRWSESVDEGGSLPTHCYAVWSTPNEPFQTEHLGIVLIRGDQLAEYVAHYLALPDEEAEKWDRFVEGLRPEQELKPAIQAFAVKEPRSDLATLKQLLLDAVGEK